MLESELSGEVENGRLVRLMIKLGFINERAEWVSHYGVCFWAIGRANGRFELDPRWSDTGDRYVPSPLPFNLDYREAWQKCVNWCWELGISSSYSGTLYSILLELIIRQYWIYHTFWHAWTRSVLSPPSCYIQPGQIYIVDERANE